MNLKGRGAHLARLRRYELMRLRDAATIESIGSSTRIDGSKLTDHEVEKFTKFASHDE